MRFYVLLGVGIGVGGAGPEHVRVDEMGELDDDRWGYGCCGEMV